MIFIFKKGLIVFFFIFFSFSISWAQPEGSFRLDQGKVRLIVSPGGSQSGIIKIFSQSEKETIVRVYIEDWEYTDKKDGSKNFYPSQSTPLSCAGWVTFSPAEFIVPAYGVKNLNYVVDVPEDAIGGHYAVMFFETLLSLPAESECIECEEVRSGVNLAIRIGTLFYVEAKDNVQRSAELRGLSLLREGKDKPLVVSLGLENKGNVDITAAGTFHIMDRQGMVYARGEFNNVYTLPGDKTELTSSWKDPIDKGKYDLIITVDLGKAMEHKIEATETTRKTKKVINQTKRTSKKTNLNSATITANPAKTPSVVATPFPPLNFKNMVQL